MITTIEDAERAVRENPQDLRTLSMAADLMQELDDPRGFDFAACLLGTITADEVMRRHPADVTAMYYAAWSMDRTDEMCEECNGVGRVKTTGGVTFRGPSDSMWALRCPTCDGTGHDNRNNAARAEALRLLAECGKVGATESPVYKGSCGYWPPNPTTGYRPWPDDSTVSEEWFDSMCGHRNDAYDPDEPVDCRLWLLDTYAKADTGTRQRWAAKTRALTAKEEVPT